MALQRMLVPFTARPLGAPPNGCGSGVRFVRAAGALARAVLVAPVLLGAGCSDAAEGQGAPEAQAEHQAPVAAVEVIPRDLSRLLSSSAPVEARITIRLASRAAGTLEAVLHEEGDAVTEGTVLARLDVSEEAAQLARARAREEQARHEYDRAAELREEAILSSSAYEHARATLLVAQSERRLWETRVGFGEVTAPRDAVVTARHVEAGEAVDAQEALFELAAMDALVVRLGVSELDVVHLREGQAVPVRLDAMPDLELDGAIRRIFPMADRGSRLVTVEVALPPESFERGVRPGYLARVRTPIDARPDVLAVPASAIGEDGERRYVLAIEDGRLARREVELGVTRGAWTEVRAGLEAGAIVLATNPIDMREGQAVRIVGWRG